MIHLPNGLQRDNAKTMIHEDDVVVCLVHGQEMVSKSSHPQPQ